jgi:hypothetical protein
VLGQNVQPKLVSSSAGGDLACVQDLYLQCLSFADSLQQVCRLVGVVAIVLWLEQWLYDSSLTSNLCTPATSPK